MKSPLAKKLKAILDSMSQEDFNTDWDEIISFDLKGPSFADVFEYNASHFQVDYDLPEEGNTYNVPVNSYNLAA
ncbi:hypothetical protein DZC72_04205 [Maribacter algicola]|uniref:Uncharacterized protein n=1 Tax=Maribacter algicola TaxID=2498892 RepID=A0A426RLG5_9FLAO|nr:hypothetical protein [Maribacter algicola]RRQ49800.1 hypothetical protein DZC72_04205 [Maribacter algicola]